MRGVGETARARCHLEQRVVFALCIRRYQLHEELDVCGFCCLGIVGCRVYLDDAAAPSERYSWAHGYAPIK
jgi:hypothetical protein